MVKYVVGNWKMHGSHALARELAEVAREAVANVQVVLAPPAIYLNDVAKLIKGGAAALAGQDCHAVATGAFTGDISALMLKEAGCAYVIVGHSERRMHHFETDEQVRAKAEAAILAGLVPIICVGETLAARKSGEAETVVKSQLTDCLPQNGKFMLAYEPVWAIGTGLNATSVDIASMHRLMAQVAGAQVPVLYGGSVKPANAAEILSVPGVSGVLVGGASVVADEFREIINAAASSGAGKAAKQG